MRADSTLCPTLIQMYILARKPLVLQLETITLSNIIYFKSIISKYLYCPKIWTWKSVVALMWPPSGPCPPIQLPGGRSPFTLWPFSNFLNMYRLLILSPFWETHNKNCSWRLHLIFWMISVLQKDFFGNLNHRNLDWRHIWYMKACRTEEKIKAQYHYAPCVDNFNCGPHHLIPGQYVKYEWKLPTWL